MREFIRIQNKKNGEGPYDEGETWHDIVNEDTFYRCEFIQINSIENCMDNAGKAVSNAKIRIRPICGLNATSRILLEEKAWNVVGEPKRVSRNEVEIIVKRAVAG